MPSMKLLFLFVTFAAASPSVLRYFCIDLSAPFYTLIDVDGAWKEILREARKCYEEISQGNQSICHSYEVNVQRCSQPLVDYFVDCLPEKSKDLPPVILKGTVSVIETFCSSNGELLLEAFNPCIYEHLEQRNKTNKEECKSDVLLAKLEKFNIDVPSKSELCQVALEIQNCWQEYVGQNCNSPKARELFSKIYGAAFSACKK
ncbi:uncharacterized protein LOC108908960 isoform X2 [Anoplophora glabripennis]|uniref:uncharacterized protein LOC108908960 isoform X2 n=1 Tax=Anoplophora glabripennis TaxID=217634 RepID=UPI000874C07A|nr:uncharacterized protein LOC108908960 isoform X2 [Anoplophora glabripennis]